MMAKRVLSLHSIAAILKNMLLKEQHRPTMMVLTQKCMYTATVQLDYIFKLTKELFISRRTCIHSNESLDGVLVDALKVKGNNDITR